MIRLFCVPQRNGINRIKERGGCGERKRVRERERFTIKNWLTQL